MPFTDETRANSLAFRKRKMLDRGWGTWVKVRGVRLYRTWTAMKQRCCNPNLKNYPWYGGKGVVVCDEWLDYATFRAWVVSNGYSKAMTIDRIDSDGNYEPSNCRWCTSAENSKARWEGKRVTENLP